MTAPTLFGISITALVILLWSAIPVPAAEFHTAPMSEEDNSDALLIFAGVLLLLFLRIYAHASWPPHWRK